MGQLGAQVCGHDVLVGKAGHQPGAKSGKDLGKITTENQPIQCTQVRLSTKRTNQILFLR